MLHPYLENTAKTIQYIFLWTVFALIQIFVLYSLLALPFWMLVLDGFVHAAVFGLMGILLWSVIRYGNFAVLNNFQQLINHIALGILTLIIWLGIGFGSFYVLFGETYNSQLIPLLPVRGLIGVLVYLLIIQQYKNSLEKLNCENLENESLIDTQEEIQSIKQVDVEILERIAVKSGSKIHVVTIPEILFLQADGDYVQIFTLNGKYLKEQTMKYFEEHLPVNQFVRVHRSVIVNVEMISRIELYEKQNQLLTLKNGQQIKTSPAGYKILRATLNL
jgi:hypothetical protein